MSPSARRRALPLFVAFAIAGVGVAAACSSAPTLDDARSNDPPPEGAPPDEDAPLAPTDAGRDATRDAAPIAPPVACGAKLPGPPLGSVTEAEPGFAAALAAVDTTAVSDPLDYSGESKLGRAVINFMLGRSSGTSVSRAEALDAGTFGRVLLASAAKEDGGVDFLFLRRGLHYAYLCSRPVPRDLADLVARYGDYSGWSTRTIPCARPKDGPRRIHEDVEQGVYVAETLVDGGVRETEVLFTRLRTDGQLDFAVYNADGSLSDRSTFATATSEVTSAAPYTCMTCHIDPDAGSLSRLFPSGTGAGCK